MAHCPLNSTATIQTICCRRFQFAGLAGKKNLVRLLLSACVWNQGHAVGKLLKAHSGKSAQCHHCKLHHVLCENGRPDRHWNSHLKSIKEDHLAVLASCMSWIVWPSTITEVQILSFKSLFISEAELFLEHNAAVRSDSVAERSPANTSNERLNIR